MARVGNAVLINWTRATARWNVSALMRAGRESEQLVADMCIFALVPCEPVVPDDVRATEDPAAPQTTLLTTEQLVEAQPASARWELLASRRTRRWTARRTG